MEKMMNNIFLTFIFILILNYAKYYWNSLINQLNEYRSEYNMHP